MQQLHKEEEQEEVSHSGERHDKIIDYRFSECVSVESSWPWSWGWRGEWRVKGSKQVRNHEINMGAVWFDWRQLNNWSPEVKAELVQQCTVAALFTSELMFARIGFHLIWCVYMCVFFTGAVTWACSRTADWRKDLPAVTTRAPGWTTGASRSPLRMTPRGWSGVPPPSHFSNRQNGTQIWRSGFQQTKERVTGREGSSKHCTK